MQEAREAADLAKALAEELARIRIVYIVYTVCIVCICIGRMHRTYALRSSA